MKAYYYVKDENKIGPLSKADLKGKITKETLVWKEGMENWIAASQLSELNDLFQKEPPPIPGSEPEKNDGKGNVKNYALLLFLITIAMGVMECFGLEGNKFYSLLLTGTVFATFQVLRSIKKHLNKVLNITSVNKDLNILMVTSVVLGIAMKLTQSFEDRMSAIDVSDSVLLLVIITLIIAFFMNLYYYFSLGKKLSKTGNEVVSQLSKFAYATVISFVPILVLSFIMGDSDNTFLEVVISIVAALPLLYLIIGFNNSEKKLRFV